jgi:hypothetical protein
VSTIRALVQALENCPSGAVGWREFENACTQALTAALVPPLQPPRIQPRTYSGVDRRDAVFSNRHFEGTNNWARLYQELGARLVPFEFKNYESSAISKDEVLQTSHYLKVPTMGRLAVMCCSKAPDTAAHRTRNTIFTEHEKVILFLSVKQLIEMLYIKERGEDPSDLLLDLLEEFYLQHE